MRRAPTPLTIWVVTALSCLDVVLLLAHTRLGGHLGLGALGTVRAPALIYWAAVNAALVVLAGKTHGRKGRARPWFAFQVVLSVVLLLWLGLNLDASPAYGVALALTALWHQGGIRRWLLADPPEGPLEPWPSQASRSLILVGLCLVVISLGVAWRVPELKLVSAWDGYGPADFAAIHSSAGGFGGDAPTGIENYRGSLPMWSLFLATEHLGISAHSSQTCLLVAEILLTPLLALLLARVVLPDMRHEAVFVLVLLFSASSLREANLGRFGAPLYYGLYYTVADALRICGILALLRGRWLLGAALFSGAVMCHPVMGAIGCTFGLAVLVARRRRAWEQRRRLVAAGVLFLALTSSWLATSLDWSALKQGEGLPAEVWLRMCRTFSAHFFPVEFGLFSRAHHERLFPLIAFSLLLLIASRSRLPRGPHDVPLAYGSVAVLALTAFGVLCSVAWPNPTIIKLCLQRSNDLFLVFGAPYVVRFLWRESLASRLQGLLAIGLLLSPFLTPGGLPLLLSVAIAGVSLARDSRAGRPPDPWVLAGLAVASSILGAIALGGWWRGLEDSAYTGWAALRANPWLSLSCFIPPLIARLVARSPARAVSGCLVIGATIGGVGWHEKSRRFRGPAERSKAEDYLELQEWTREHTPRGALVLVDPTHQYGWRAFSERPSFGNVGEWLHTTMVYDTRGGALRLGRERFGEFGLTLEPYLSYDPPCDGFFALLRDLREVYDSLEAADFERIGRRHGVRFAVIDRTRRAGDPPLPVAFENRCYWLCRISGAEQRRER